MSLFNASAVCIRNPAYSAWNFSDMGPSRAVQGIYLLCAELYCNPLLLLLVVLLAESDIILTGDSLVGSLMLEVHPRQRTSGSYTGSAVDLCALLF